MTQVEKLKREFNKGRKHTVFSSTLKLGITALHQRCGELRESGYPVKRRLVRIGRRVLAEFSKGRKSDLRSTQC